MKKIKNLFIILLSACLVNTWPVYAEEQEYVSEEEREFYEYFNLNKNDVEEYSQNLFEEAQKAPIVPARSAFLEIKDDKYYLLFPSYLVEYDIQGKKSKTYNLKDLGIENAVLITAQ